MKGRKGLYTDIWNEREKHLDLYNKCDNETSMRFEILRHEVALANICDKYGIERAPEHKEVEPINISEYLENKWAENNKSRQINFESEEERKEALEEYERKYLQDKERQQLQQLER